MIFMTFLHCRSEGGDDFPPIAFRKLHTWYSWHSHHMHFQRCGIDSGLPQLAGQWIITAYTCTLFPPSSMILNSCTVVYYYPLSKSFMATDFSLPPIPLVDAFEHSHELPKVISKIEALDDDSIYLIIVALCYTDVTRRLKQIWPLSLTCKRLRDACLPLMFKRVVWPNKRMLYDTDDDVLMLPETLWPYIQLRH